MTARRIWWLGFLVLHSVLIAVAIAADDTVWGVFCGAAFGMSVMGFVEDLA